MQDFSQTNSFGQRILQIIKPSMAGIDRKEVLTQLTKSIADNFPADGCWLLLYSSPGVITLAASYLTARVDTRLTYYTPPIAPTATRWRLPILSNHQVMVIETRDLAGVNGCLVVATKGAEWNSDTKAVFEAIGNYVSTILIKEELQLQAQISQVYPQLHHHLSQAIVEDRDLNQLFEIAVSGMVNALQLKRGLVLTLKSSDRSQAKKSKSLSGDLLAAKNSRQVQIVTTIDLREGELPELPALFSLENSYFCRTALAAAPASVVFERNDGSATPTDRLIFQDDRLPSMVMIPLMGSAIPDRQPEAALWGWLVLQHDHPRTWHPVELKMLECQIYQIALARIHKQALKQARLAVANRTSQIQTSLQLQAKLHDAGRKRIEKLRQANELKDEFISTISHELRTPLTSMALAIEMLRQVDVDPVRRQKYLNILDEQCRREIKLVNDLLKLQQLDSHQLTLQIQSVALNQFISEQATIVADRWVESKGLELALHLPTVSPRLKTDTDSLGYILAELLMNAGKFALPQTMIEVSILADLDRVAIEIANLSKPIPSEDLPHLFERFRRGQGVTGQAIAGTGLGLALVKSLVEHLQGSIEVKSRLIETTIAKTSFMITIPTVLEDS